MNDIKLIIANNLTELRRKHSITQAELAERLNYSDKAVSKWERGESIPDVTVLKAISDIFGVTVDYLLEEEHEDPKHEKKEVNKRQKRNRSLITGISIVLVLFIATFAAANISLFGLKGCEWLPFVAAVPVSMVVWLVLNSIWFNRRRNFLIISLLMWSTLAAIFIVLLLLAEVNLWYIFTLGIPAQLIILLWSGIKLKRK
jgi:transcriptional regulator with XRE-family HTH domain